MDKPDPKNSHKKSANAYARYSGLAFQMVAVLGLAIWLGGKADAYFQTSQPWFTVGMVLLGLIGTLLAVVRDLTRP